VKSDVDVDVNVDGLLFCDGILLPNEASDGLILFFLMAYCFSECVSLESLVNYGFVINTGLKFENRFETEFVRRKSSARFLVDALRFKSNQGEGCQIKAITKHPKKNNRMQKLLGSLYGHKNLGTLSTQPQIEIDNSQQSKTKN
jgi:hypothetical protein